MSNRAGVVPDIQDGSGQMIQRNSSFQHHSHSFEREKSQMSPTGLPVQGLDDTSYSNRLYQYSNGQSLFQHGLSPSIPIRARYENLQYGMKQKTSRSAPVSVDPQLYGYGSHEPCPEPPAILPPLNLRRTRSGQAINGAIRSLKPSPKPTNRAVSPKPKAKKVKKEKKVKAHRIARLEKPLSELTRTWTHVPIINIDAYVNRSAETRRQEVDDGKNPGKVKRPINPFMLYRKAYQNRTKNWCLQNNHQVISQICGDSWPLEPDNVRAQFNEWARIERQNHQNAHPGYKFSPAKAATAKAAKRKPGKRQKLTPKPSRAPPRRFENQPYHGLDFNSRGSNMDPAMGVNLPSSAHHVSNPGRHVPEPYRPNNDVILRGTRGLGTNVAQHPGYQQENYQYNGVVNGGIAWHSFSGYQDGPEAKIDPSFMGHDQTYGDIYTADDNKVFLAIVDENPRSLQQPLEIDDGVKQEYPEYPEYPGSQTGIPDPPIFNRQLNDSNSQDIWQIIDSLDTGDEFNNKWMGAEAYVDGNFA
ncbi:hypothetical protein ACLOAV_004518 [Pseudogymnoascus australis]